MRSKQIEAIGANGSNIKGIGEYVNMLTGEDCHRANEAVSGGNKRNMAKQALSRNVLHV